MGCHPISADVRLFNDLQYIRTIIQPQSDLEDSACGCRILTRACWLEGENLLAPFSLLKLIFALIVVLM